jgi:EmrB/QacA subfamily drug resistance transporter
MRYVVALTAAVGMIMAILDVTIVNVALVPMSAAFKTDLSTIQWVVTGYFLAQAAVIPVSGYLSSRYGMKRLIILCLGIFTAGSVLCGLSQGEGMLIAFRVLQGLGGGALFPLGQAIAFSAFPPHERAQASAIIAVPILLAPVFGPTVGGLLTVNFGWEWIFFINLPVGLAAVTLGAIFLPTDHVSPRHVRTGFDYVGLLLSTLGVLAVVYAFTLVGQTRPGSVTAASPQGELHGWGDQTVLLLLAAGVALLVSFALYELRVAKDPVLDLRLFRERSFATANVVS